MLKRGYRGIGIEKKFTFMALIFLIIPSSIVFVVINSVIEKEMLKKQCEKELEIIKQSKPSIEILLEDVETISRNIVADRNVQELFEEWQTEGIIDEETLLAVQMYVEQSVYTKKYISSVSLFVEDRGLYQYGTRYDREDIVDDERKKKDLEDLKGDVLWDTGRIHEGYIVGRSNEAIVSLYWMVNNLYKLTPVGIQRIGISEGYIYSLYGTADEYEGEEAYIFNEDGYIVSSKEKSRLNQMAKKNVRKTATSTSGYYLDENREYAIFYYKLLTNGWTIVRTKRVDRLMDPIRIINVIIRAMIFMVVSFSAIYLIFQKQTIIKPIVRLARDVENIDEDNYEVRLYSDAQDEIGKLNRSIILMTQRIKNLIEMGYKRQLWQREAEIMSLQSQINPHFLYNTLDTMRWIALEHNDLVLSEQIEALSGLFRHVLNNGKELTTLREEVKHLENYLAIQKSRFGEKIKLNISVDESIYDCKVLKLILQPVVENAFVHGLENKMGGGHIHVSIKRNGQNIVYRVVDNGVGTNQEEIQRIIDSPERQSRIYALKNVNDRLRLKYGNEYGIIFRSIIGQGTDVQVRLKGIFEEDGSKEDV